MVNGICETLVIDFGNGALEVPVELLAVILFFFEALEFFYEI